MPPVSGAPAFVRDTGSRGDSARTGVAGFGHSQAGRVTAVDKKPEQRNAVNDELNQPVQRGILNPSNDGNGGNQGVNFVCRLDRELYRVITNDIQTDEVIITDERIEHIKEHHPNDYERFNRYLAEIIQKPDFIIRDERPYTGMLLKAFTADEKGEHFRIALRLATSRDPAHYKNSIITFLKIRDKEWERLIRNKEILYKSK